MGVESQPLAELVAYLAQVHQVEELNQPPLVMVDEGSATQRMRSPTGIPFTAVPRRRPAAAATSAASCTCSASAASAAVKRSSGAA